jgi:hypothetical protein
MRSVLRPAIAALAAMALAAGCGDRVPPEARGRDVVRPHLGFAVNVPEGWNFRDLDGDVALEIYPQPPASAAGEAAARPVAEAYSAEAAASAAKAETPAGAPEPGLLRRSSRFGCEGRTPAHARPLLAAVHVAVIDRAGIGLAEWADQAVGESRELQPDLEVVKREPGQLADGRNALVLVLRNPRGLSPTVQRMLLAMTGRRAYAVLATAPEPEGPAVEAAFQKCFDSFIVW